MIDPDVAMGEMLEFALVTFSAVFFVVDPFAAIPIFVSITHEDSLAKRRLMARRAALAAFLTLTFFAFTGGLVFQALGVSLGAFQIAGGIMLLLMSVDMMRATPSRTRSTEEEQRESIEKDDIAIVPMAIPILSGPGAIATVMVLMRRAAWNPGQTIIVLLSVALTCVLSWLILRMASRAQQVLGQTMLRVLGRVMGLLLAAVAVQFMIGGLRDAFPSLR